MKVLHVIDALGVGGGAEHSLATMLPLLRERGVESAVVTLYPREGGLQQQLLDRGFDVRALQSTTWPERVRDLRRAVHHHEPDIVHATLYNSCIATRFACIGMAVAQLNSLVNAPYDPVAVKYAGIRPWRSRLAREIDSATARALGQHFHAISETVRDEAITALRLPPRSITVIPRGRPSASAIPCDEVRRTEIRSALGIEPFVPVVLNVGRQDVQKNQAALIRAFGEVTARLPNAVLLIAGRPGNASDAIQRAISEVAWPQQVRLLGHRDDLDALYCAADVFVFPSVFEGLGCSLIEAMAAELPIIGSDAPAIVELLEGGRHGEIVPRADRQALSHTLLQLLGDEERRRILGEQARKQFIDHYTTDHIVGRMVDLYQRLGQ